MVPKVSPHRQQRPQPRFDEDQPRNEMAIELNIEYRIEGMKSTTTHQPFILLIRQ